MDKTRLVITENHREYVTVVEAQGLEVQQVQVSAEGAHKRPSTQNFLQNSQQQLYSQSDKSMPYTVWQNCWCSSFIFSSHN